MLSLFMSKEIRPEVETVDRDPGIVSLISAFARFTARQTAAAVRSFHQRENGADVFSSSSAWPHDHRTN